MDQVLLRELLSCKNQEDIRAVCRAELEADLVRAEHEAYVLKQTQQIDSLVAESIKPRKLSWLVRLKTLL